MTGIGTDDRPAKRSAFTLTELLVVFGVLGLLALMILPSMAGGWEKATRVQCADNLRRLHAASMQYANEYNGWLPVWMHPSTREINVMHGYHYSRFVWDGMPNTKVPKNTSYLGEFQNAGYLYLAGLIDDGRPVFCPSIIGGSLEFFAAEFYEPLLTSDASGTVRSSYSYNPRVTNPPINVLRRFQKTSQFVPRKLFIVDHINTDNPETAHDSERGWNVVFTDGSVQFSRNAEVYRRISEGLIPRYDSVGLEQLFDLLEEEH